MKSRRPLTIHVHVAHTFDRYPSPYSTLLYFFTGFSSIPLSNKNFLSISSLTSVELRHLLDEAASLKNLYKNEEAVDYSPLKGKSMAMIFEKRSTRTRVSTETGFTKLGGHPLFLR